MKKIEQALHESGAGVTPLDQRHAGFCLGPVNGDLLTLKLSREWVLRGIPMRLFVLLLCLASGASLFFTSLGETNEMPMGLVGGGASAKGHHQSIRMESEEVTIQLLHSSYIVDAVFHFFNSGETTTEWVGFPKLNGDKFQFVKFETWVNDQEAQFTETPEAGRLPGLWNFAKSLVSGKSFFSNWSDSCHWMAKEVTFPGHAATVTRVRYEAAYAYGCATYIYGTGSLWKGTIGKAVFIIDGRAINKGNFSVRYQWGDSRTEKKDGNQNGKVNFRVRGEPATSTQTLISPNYMKYEISDFKPSDPLASIQVCF